MKNIYFTILVLILIIFVFSVAQDVTKKKATLVVHISGIESNEGTIKIALNNSEENYSDNGNVAFRGGEAAINEKKSSCTFDEVPYGEYAVKVFHDENDNNELDSNFMGVPKEPYGFSNDARGTFGPASWEDARFEIDQDSVIITITVQ